MLKNFKILSLIAAFVFSLATFGFAQETTGSVEVTVTDPAGARVPGATVELASDSFKRTVTTNDEGFARILQLNPGLYTVNVNSTNFQPFSRDNVQVVLGITSPVKVTLAVAGTTAEVIVSTGELPIDPTSSKIQTNLTEEELQQLPKGTNFQSALKAVPSVRNEPAAAGFSIDGATGVENSFIVDGQEVGNFRTGDLNGNNDLPFQLVKELQVKNSGFAAEFGGATGGVINVITKSGGNTFHGEIGADFDTSKLDANSRPIQRANPDALEYIRPIKDAGTNFFPFASLGGPVIKDRLWFFGNSTQQFFSNTRNYSFADGRQASYRREDRYDYIFGRLDASITDKLRVYSTYVYNPIKINGLLPTFNTLAATNDSITMADPGDLVDLPSEFDQAELGGRQPSTNFNINGSYVATSNLVFTARFSRGYLNEKLSSYGIPTVTRRLCSFDGAAFGFNCVAGDQNVPTNSSTNFDISIRKNFEADASLIVNLGGRHQFKFGYQRFNISNTVDSGYFTRGFILFRPGRTFTAADGTNFGNRPGEAGVGRLVRIGTFGEASSSNQAIYVQDTYQPISNLTFNLGVRTEREDVPSFTPGFPGIRFNFKDKIAPRLGFAYDPFKTGKFKIFANYGQFFDRFKYELPRGSFGGELFLNDYFPLLQSLPNPSDYTLQYGLDNSLIQIDSRVPSNDPTDNRVDPDLKPVVQTEFTVGTQYDLGRSTILSARYTHKQISNTIEDIGYHNGANSEAYFIGNPGEGVCAQSACGQYEVGGPAAKPERKYDAFEVILDKRFARNFTINANYTYSRLFGNYSGLASTDEFIVNGASRDSPNVNRFFDTPFDGFNVGGAPNNGRLATDRPHVFKFFGSYTFGNEGSFLRLPNNNELELSAFYTATSGTPVTTRVDLVNNAYIPLFGRGDLGRTETFMQTDASLKYRYKFGRENRYAMQFNIDALNLFNEAHVLGIFESISDGQFLPTNFGLAGGPGSYQEFDRAFFDGRVTADRILQLVNNDPEDGFIPDARYKQPILFQGPRSVRFGFRFIF